MLTDAECRVLVAHCCGHLVARCEQCQKHDKFAELGSDVLGRRALGKRLERSVQLIKTSDELRTASEILAAESQARSQRIRDLKVEWPDVPPEKTMPGKSQAP
jgi:hypothetical protein